MVTRLTIGETVRLNTTVSGMMKEVMCFLGRRELRKQSNEKD
jgi:hypothetical protein